MSRADFAGLAQLARQEWRERSACAGAFAHGVEFIDPAPADVPDIIRSYCHRCPVVGHCREEADRLAPFRHLTVMGARAYDKGEPVDGWEVAS